MTSTLADNDEMKLGVLCFQKFILFVLIFQFLECSAKIISISVRHVENFEVKGPGDQDVVHLDDSDIMAAWNKELILDELKFQEGLKKEKGGVDSKAKDGELGNHKSHLHLQDKNSAQMVGQKGQKFSKSEYRHLGNLRLIEPSGESDVDRETIEQEGMDNKKHLQEQEKNYEPEEKILGKIESVIMAKEGKHSHSIHNTPHRFRTRKHFRKFSSHNHGGEKTIGDEESELDSSVEQKVLDIENEEQRIEDQLSPPLIPLDEEDTEGGPQIPRPLHRVKRQIDINAIADAHLNTKNSSSTENDGSVDVMTADDRQALENKTKESQSALVKYLGATLGSVVLFSFIAFCFLKDPKGCITAFGTGCPCCILCLPCIRKCQERTDMERIMRENMNIYLPGVIIHDDGTIDAYKVSPEEVDIVMEIVDIITES